MSTAFKQVANNAFAAVATAPSPATSGTSIVVASGKGALFPAPGNGFWCTIWNSTTFPNPNDDANREIVLVTAKSTDTFTMTRAQLSTSARTVTTSDSIAILDVDQLFKDIHTAINNIESLGSDKRVIFNDTGTISTSADLVFDKTNKRVGIGVASPGSSLDVINGVNVVDYYKIGGTNFLSNQGATTNVVIGTLTPHTTIGSGGNNTVVGSGAGAALVTTGANNVLLGAGAGNGVTTGVRNVLIGPTAAQGITTHTDVVAVGYQAGVNKAVNGGVYIGKQASGNQGSNGSPNTSVGTEAGYGDGGGGGNNSVFIGYQAGTTGNGGTGTLGNRLIWIGDNAGTDNNGFLNDILAVGYQANASAANQAVFGGTSNAFTHWYIGRGVTSVNAAVIDFQPSKRTGTNVAGNSFTLAAGVGTGTGKKAFVKLQVPGTTGAGTGAQTLNDRFIVAQEVTLTDAATSLFEISLPTLTMAGGQIDWTIIATDGTDMQAYSGITTFAAVNKGAVYTTTSTQVAANEAKAVSAGTLTATFAFLTGTNKVTMQVTPAGSLTETTYAIYFTITNNSPQAVTLL